MESKARPTVQSSMPMLSDAGPGAGDAELLETHVAFMKPWV